MLGHAQGITSRSTWIRIRWQHQTVLMFLTCTDNYLVPASLIFWLHLQSERYVKNYTNQTVIKHWTLQILLHRRWNESASMKSKLTWSRNVCKHAVREVYVFCCFGLIYVMLWKSVALLRGRRRVVMDWIGLSSVLRPRQHSIRLYGRRFLQVKRPNQQYQSTEGTYSTQINQTYNKQTSGR